MSNGASPQPDEACACGLASARGWAGAGGKTPAGAQGSSQCELIIHRLQRSCGRCRPSLQPEPVMTLPRTAAEVLSGHVRLEVRCIDRAMLTFRQPRLQYGQGIHRFFCQHRGNQFVSSALMLPMTEHFAADIHHYIDTRRLDLVRFARRQSKDQVAKGYLAGKSGGDQILFVGVAQEKTRVWRTARRRDPATGRPYPWLYQEQAMAGHWYFYGFDAD